MALRWPRGREKKVVLFLLIFQVGMDLSTLEKRNYGYKIAMRDERHAIYKMASVTSSTRVQAGTVAKE